MLIYPQQNFFTNNTLIQHFDEIFRLSRDIMTYFPAVQIESLNSESEKWCFIFFFENIRLSKLWGQLHSNDLLLCWRLLLFLGQI